MKITDIGHSAYGCYDMDAALRFYALLGINESFRMTKEDGSIRLIYLHVAGDRFIELFPGGPSPEERQQAGKVSYKHLCLLTDDMDSTLEHLRSNGIAIDRGPLRGGDGNTQAWITDPDGNPIELMQISPDSPQRAAAEGRKPVVPSQ